MSQVEIFRDDCRMAIRTDADMLAVEMTIYEADEYFDKYYCDWSSVFYDLMTNKGYAVEFVG